MDNWAYLKTEPLQTRQVLAAWFLRDCVGVVEIGPWTTPIAPYLRNGQDYTPIEHQAEHTLSTLTDWAPRRPYGVAALGLDLRDMTPETWATLERLVRGAKRTVIEYATTWSQGVLQANRIEEWARPVMSIALDFRGNLMPREGYPPRLERRMVVLECGS